MQGGNRERGRKGKEEVSNDCECVSCRGVEGQSDTHDRVGVRRQARDGVGPESTFPKARHVGPRELREKFKFCHPAFSLSLHFPHPYSLPRELHSPLSPIPTRLLHHSFRLLDLGHLT